ncbi:DNA polymerase III subunit gamma/tau [Luteimonas sp. MC1750]|uniref:DNA polymerase III subunit gamma/tau n=1 Tax=Luteimonas sp. MC1750 TaxID=2799326 RepID=UPI0018F0D9C6|nr:DNA polymerase III subunit gamma/tau [Luteimonas sp. MC1750]MBJ6983120.1 DNA polymerase III subunit gamma/tau [Luteimonas sp. MC1750]QQO05172.1 DNA polymerase III subunit gamma/tau [Luteimonas sp. MC1750]
MSYLVLARKWRPKRFAELVGQEHVVRALVNALDSGRVHHAFLFTGTRGVGKTTIARIFAKSLNCERGASSDPCGECETCQAIDAGRYIDLLEIDAASNTGVDNVRDLIDNAQYMPSRGRYKVYLIDEVHMLSKAAFNALLKTLEEPPEHVKFLFATTDPQKLLVTVLSRCLQFNLKRLEEEQIRGQIARILVAEGIEAEPGAVRQLARAADGSMRDGLSLLDQAIAYSGADAGAALTDDAVATMLGSVDRTQVAGLLSALSQDDGAGLMATIEVLAGFSPDWGGVLDALAEALHRIQVRQLVPGSEVEADGVDLDALASLLRPELVQLWYQMAVSGRRDIGLAPSARVGFEMSLLRMLAFRPGEGGGSAAPAGGGSATGTAGTGGGTGAGRSAAAAARAALEGGAPARAGTPVRAAASPASPLPPEPQTEPPMHQPEPAPNPGPRRTPPVSPPATHAAPFDDPPPWPEEAPERAEPPRAPPPRATSGSPAAVPARAPAPPVPATPAPVIPPAPPAPPASPASASTQHAPASPASTASISMQVDADTWPDLVAGLDLRGPVRELAANSAFVALDGDALRLSLPESDDHLRAPFLVQQLASALGTRWGAPPQIRFEAGAPVGDTLHARTGRERDQRQGAAEAAFHNDPHVRRLMEQGARVVPDSIRPIQEQEH